MLGLPPTKAGQVVGWVYDAEHPIGDNYVDFGLYADNLSYSDFANGFDSEGLGRCFRLRPSCTSQRIGRIRLHRTG